MRSPAITILLSLLLAGCGQAPTPEAAAPAPAPVVAVVEEQPDAAEVVAAAETTTQQAGVTFTIEQISGDCNPQTPYRARLSWTIADPAKGSIYIRAESMDNANMATHDAVSGTADTHDWVWPDMPFYLIERTSGEVLATVVAGAETCN